MTNEELAEATESERSVLIATLTREDFKRLIYSGRRGVIGELMMVVERGQKVLDLWFTRFGFMVSSTGPVDNAGL